MPGGAPLALAFILVPIETLSYLSRALSLGLRLAANLTAGHLLFAIISGLGGLPEGRQCRGIAPCVSGHCSQFSPSRACLDMSVLVTTPDQPSPVGLEVGTHGSATEPSRSSGPSQSQPGHAGNRHQGGQGADSEDPEGADHGSRTRRRVGTVHRGRPGTP